MTSEQGSTTTRAALSVLKQGADRLMVLLCVSDQRAAAG